jgi:hypothetical protein
LARGAADCKALDAALLEISLDRRDIKACVNRVTGERVVELKAKMFSRGDCGTSEAESDACGCECAG